MVSSSQDHWYMEVEKTGAKHAQLTQRQTMSNGVLQPQGGYYQYAVDMEAKGPRTTEVTLYYPPFSGTLTNAITEWTKGHTDSCQGYNDK